MPGQKPDEGYNLRRIFEEMELELVKSLRRNLSRHEAEEKKEGFRWEMWQRAKLRNLRRYQKENREIVGKIRPEVRRTVNRAIRESYQDGQNMFTRVWNRVKQLFKKKQPGVRFPEGPTEKGLDTPAAQETAFFGINDKKVRVLQESVQNDLQRAEAAVLRRMDDVYRRTVYAEQIKLAAAGKTLDRAIDEATKQFLQKGIDCIEYKNGHRVNIASYAEMALRTASHRATLLGEGKKRDELGIHTVVVSAHANTCPLCAPWQGKVLVDDVFSSGTKEEAQRLGYPLLSEAIKAGLLHPNCRHTIATYFPGITPIPEIPDAEKARKTYEAEQKQRAIERRIKKWKRITEGTVDAKNRTYAQRKIRDAQQEMRDHLAENPELRRNYSREKSREIPSGVSDPELRRGIIETELRKVGVKGEIHTTPKQIDVESLSFDDAHVNAQRQHGVSEAEAKEFIRSARGSVTVWKGQYERYYSDQGVAYVDLKNNLIRTAFKPEEFSENVEKILEVLKIYE